MKQFKLRIAVSYVFLLFSSNLFAQVEVGKVLSRTSINEYHVSHLVLIDFWATWCGPCIHVGKQLEVTQEVFKDDLTIISLSNESEETVQRYIDKNNPGLTIAIDNNGQTFKKYGVTRSLPYSVLLDQGGTLLWKGHPADLSNEMIKRYIRQNRGSISETESAVREFVDNTKKDFSGYFFSVKKVPPCEDWIDYSPDGMEFQGDLKTLLSELMQIPADEVITPDNYFVEAKIGIDKLNLGYELLCCRISDTLNLEHTIHRKEKEYYMLTINSPEMLWNSDQIDLGSFDGAYMVANDNLTVDNASVKSFAFRLSNYIDFPVSVHDDSDILHDWLLHYRFFDLTRSQLATQYGIEIIKTSGIRKIHHFE